MGTVSGVEKLLFSYCDSENLLYFKASATLPTNDGFCLQRQKQFCVSPAVMTILHGAEDSRQCAIGLLALAKWPSESLNLLPVLDNPPSPKQKLGFKKARNTLSVSSK